MNFITVVPEMKNGREEKHRFIIGMCRYHKQPRGSHWKMPVLNVECAGPWNKCKIALS